MPDPRLADARAVACDLLQEIIERWERHALRAALNEYEMRRLIRATQIVGDRRMQERANALIRYTPSYDKVGEAHLPVLTLDGLLANVHAYAQHSERLRLCVDGEVGPALELAKSSLDVEEVALTLAALGDFASAMRIATDDPRIEAFRRESIAAVAFIEAFRRNRTDWIEWLWDHSDRERLGRLDVAIGLLGHRPWDPYPYPDW